MSSEHTGWTGSHIERPISLIDSMLLYYGMRDDNVRLRDEKTGHMLRESFHNVSSVHSVRTSWAVGNRVEYSGEIMTLYSEQLYNYFYKSNSEYTLYIESYYGSISKVDEFSHLQMMNMTVEKRHGVLCLILKFVSSDKTSIKEMIGKTFRDYKFTEPFVFR